MKNITRFKTTEEIFQQASELADLPILIASHPTLQMQGVVIHPTEADPNYHIYYYSGLDEEEANTALTHELCHIIRTVRVPKDKRQRVRGIPIPEYYKAYDDIGTSMFSYPDDLEIERFIATCPDLQLGQKKIWKPVIAFMREEIEEDFRKLPERLFLAKHALDYSLLRRVGELIGEKTTRHFYGYRNVMQEGKALLEISDGVRRNDVAGDREVTGLWIERLGMGDIYSLVPENETEPDNELAFLMATNPNVMVVNSE